MKVLVVDDDELLVEQLQRYLTRHKHHVDIANSGEEAINVMVRLGQEGQMPQAIFTDIRMGVMSGLDLVKKVQDRWPTIFIVVMTGYATIENAVEAMRRGAFDFITKPFRIPLLQEKLQEIENEVMLRRELTEIPTEPDRSPVTIDPLYWLKEKTRELPLMIISPRPLDDFTGQTDQTGQEAIQYLCLTPENVPNAIPPGHLHTLLNEITYFGKSHLSGLIYFEGLGQLNAIHGWHTTQNFIARLLESLKPNTCHLCLGVSHEEFTPDQFEILQQILSQEQLINISRSLAHEARLSILYFIAQRESIAFNEMLKNLNFTSSASLTFHLKQLVQANLVDRGEQGNYGLTSEGRTALEALNRLRHSSVGNPYGAASLLTIAGKGSLTKNVIPEED